MVFLSFRHLMRKKRMVPNPARVWKREMAWRLVWHLRGRVRNCYKLSQNAIKHSLRFSTVDRPVRRKNINYTFSSRIAAGCGQHGIQYSSFMRSLYESNIALNRKMLSQLSAYEPRTFQSLCEFVKKKHSESVQQGLAAPLEPSPSGVITRDMIKNAAK